MTTTCVDSSDTQIKNSTTTRKKPNNNNQTKTQRKNNQSSHLDRVDSPNVKRNKKPKNISKNTDDSSSNTNPFLSMKNNNRSVKKNHIDSGSGETVDKKENIFLNAANSRMKYDEKYVKHSNEKTGERGKNIFMASASASLSDDSSFRSYHNGGQGKRNETRPNSSSNYFIHNSKIQMSRQNPQLLEPIQSDIKTDKAVPTFVDIKDQQQFPSLSMKVEQENVSSNNTKQSVWNKRPKIDVISTAPVSAPVPPPVTASVPAPVPAPVSAPVSVNVTEQSPAISVYKPKILPHAPAPLYSLSKDNIFLAAFMKPTLTSLDDITETSELDNIMISNAPLSALVDECDSTYDRFYN
jgi:hypothetical protein